MRAPRQARAHSHVERDDGDQSSPCRSRQQQQQQQTSACGGEVRLKLDNLDTGCSLRLLLLVRVRLGGLGPTVDLSDMMCGYDKDAGSVRALQDAVRARPLLGRLRRADRLRVMTVQTSASDASDASDDVP